MEPVSQSVFHFIKIDDYRRFRSLLRYCERLGAVVGGFAPLWVRGGWVLLRLQ